MFQNVLQYTRSKINYVIGEFIYINIRKLIYVNTYPSDMDLRIGKVKNYNNKILIALPSFKIGTNLNQISSPKK